MSQTVQPRPGTSLLVSKVRMFKFVLSLSLCNLSQILNICDPLTPLLSVFIISIVTDPGLIELPTSDAILTLSPIPTLLMSLTNDIYHYVVLLELDAKLNALLLSLFEESVAMIVLIPLLDNDYPTLNSSPIHHYLIKYMHFYHRSATFAFPIACYCTNMNSYRNYKTYVQA